MSAKDLEKYVGAISATGFAPGAKNIKPKKSKLKFGAPKVSEGKYKKRLKEAYHNARKDE